MAIANPVRHSENQLFSHEFRIKFTPSIFFLCAQSTTLNRKTRFFTASQQMVIKTSFKPQVKVWPFCECMGVSSVHTLNDH